MRESGHCLLMEALAARGNAGEALRAYERLRVTLRDELGTVPGAPATALHQRLLEGGVASAAPAEPARPQGPPPEER
jgi:DNA-binding SARP family transcriptional activator